MPTPITHLIVSLPVNATIIKNANTRKILFWSFFAAVIPDLDLLGYFFNISINNFFGHRGFTHSLFFSLLVAMAICLLVFQDVKIKSKQFVMLFLNFFLITSSHALLDACTDFNFGVALFSPFSNYRFALPWAPIKTGTIGLWNYYVLGFKEIFEVESTFIAIALVHTWTWRKYILKKK